MILYSLICDQGHDFEGWFHDSATFESQAEQSLVTCPFCGSSKISRGVMAPHISRRAEVDDSLQRKMLHELRDKLIEGSEDVGDRFPEEARKIEDGETERRAIRGRASFDEAKALLEDGIKILPIPSLPTDGN